MSEKQLPFGFERTDDEKALAVLTETEGMFLTEIALSLKDIPESDETASLTDRKMAEWKEGKLRVTERGMKAVSLYPLLGRRKTRSIYPEAFFPFLLSVVASGVLPSTRWHRTISSDFFSSLFPGLDKERAINAATRSIERLIELGVADDRDAFLSVSKESTLSFLSLKEEERLAVILDRDNAYNAAKRDQYARFISLSSKLSGIEEGRIEEYLALIEKLTGVSIALEDLLLFSILEKDGREYSGRIMTQERTSHFTISSDFSITYTGRTPEKIFLYASPVMSDRTTEWRITKQSAKAAFSLKMTPEEIKRSLEEISSYPLPETVYPRIELWYSSFSSIRTSRALILVTDERNARIIEALPTLRMHIEEKLSDTIYIMRKDTEALWRRALENAGFDMLGKTEGPGFMEEEERSSIACSSFIPPEIPEERIIPFDEGLKKRLVENARTPLMKALAESGFITAESDNPRLPETVNGLYYQEKMRLVRTAEDTNQKIYAEFIDGSVLVGHVKKEDDEHVSILGKSIEQCKIWKTAVLPVSIRDLEMPSSDSDSL